MNKIITIATDFTLKNTFVGICKGVIYSINPQVTIVDITHDIEPYNIAHAALLLRSYYNYYPFGSIHVCVVDPGVGSQRRKLIVYSNNHYFVGPDNGIFSTVLTGEFKAININNHKYVLNLDSPTFQARDVFAPVSAWLAKGVAMSEFGEPVSDVLSLQLPIPKVTDHTVEGEIIEIDTFGNAITNILNADLPRRPFEVSVNGIKVPFLQFYAQMQEGLGCLINSSQSLEFFVFQGDASKYFNLQKGDKVIVK